MHHQTVSRNTIGRYHVLMLCLNSLLEPIYLLYFCGMKKETHMYSFKPIIEIMKMIIITIQVILYDGYNNRK